MKVSSDMRHKYATIDVGTNSIRCLLTEIDNGQFISSEKTLEMTRIGEGVNDTHLLKKDRIDSSIDAIEKFVSKARDFGAEQIFAMATSAVRDAENRSVFLEGVKARTGIEIEVISGELEAELGFKGVMAGAENRLETKLVIDIGGGSTEFMVGNAEENVLSVSINVGAVRLTNLFSDDYEKMNAFIEEKSAEVIGKIKQLTIGEVIGIGGTATTFMAMKKRLDVYNRQAIHNQNITQHEITSLDKLLKQLDVESRKKVPGLDPKRADIICAGGTILEFILNALNKEQMTISDFDNLEGYLHHQLNIG